MNDETAVGTLPTKITDKQTRFVEEYLVDCNATQAAIRAGYSRHSAANIGWENVRKPQIRNSIREKLNELTMTSAEAAMRLTRWGRGSIASFVRLTAEGEAVLDLSTPEAQDALDLIRKIKQTEQTIRSKDGSEYTTRRTEIELHDAKSAVVQMAKLHGMFRDDEQPEDVMTPERKLEVLEQMRRLVRIENKEKRLAAPKQIAARSD